MSKIRSLMLSVLALTLALVACDRPATPTPTPRPTFTPSPSPVLRATLQIGKIVDSKEAMPGAVLQYVLVVMNDMLWGEDPGTNVTLMDKLPAELDLVGGSLSPEATYDPSTRTIHWQGTVPRGGSIQVLFKARMTEAAAGMRSIINTVLVTDAFGQQREASAQTQVIMPPSPTATFTPVPPTATAQPTAPPPPTVVPSPTEVELPQDSVPYVKSLVVTPDEPPVYYLVVGDGLYRSTDRGSTWSAEALQGIPTGALVTVVAIDYMHPQTMYLGTSKGLYRREGSQEPWSLVHTFQVMALAVDLENPDVLWAGIGYSTEMRAVLVKSNDRGRTWGKADFGITGIAYGTWVSAILIHPKNPNIIWAHVRPITRGDWPRGLVYRGGRDGTWEQLRLGAPFDFEGGPDPWKNQDVCFVCGLAYDPNLNALYAGCDVSYYNGEKRIYRLLRSLNADAPNSADVRWELAAELGVAPTLSTNSVRPLAVDAREPKSLFVSLDVTSQVGQPRFRLLVSHDDGKTWTDMSLKGLPEG